MVAIVETKDKYRSFGNDDEPWSSTLELWKNGEKLKVESYTLNIYAHVTAKAKESAIQKFEEYLSI
ncbi:hypothetical protein OJ967_09740 [Peribacillus frigoritolerans]|uniref:hypothetical protein n=1 Tax=Peribacillus frigoritolerans TaxID=450367 RepID=UPI002226B052|nr:hypothetical protein [Peribacillus frigoritolerans]UYZ00740.1 hypothetical protein OJ967_09740 [Peribacillus frigoritolerans]